MYAGGPILVFGYVRDGFGNPVVADVGPTGTLILNGADTVVPVSFTYAADGAWVASAIADLSWSVGDKVHIRVQLGYTTRSFTMTKPLGEVEPTPAQVAALFTDAECSRKILKNRHEITGFNTPACIMTVYDDDDVTPFLIWDMATDGGEPVITFPGAQTKRVPQ